MKTITPYTTKPNLPKDTSRRSWLIFKLERDWPAMRYGLRNGRSLNRLSTRQLEAKVRQHDRMQSKQLHSYVSWMNSFEAA